MLDKNFVTPFMIQWLFLHVVLHRVVLVTQVYRHAVNVDEVLLRYGVVDVEMVLKEVIDHVPIPV